MATNLMLPPTAAQPAATTNLQAPLVLNPEGLKRLGSSLANRFTMYEQDRKLAELKWARNNRQFLGIYDPDIELVMDKNRSRAYPKLTRVKCVSMLSRLMNLLFQASDKNWTVEPSAVPNLETDDLQKVLDALMPSPQQGGAPAPPPTDEQIEQAIRKFAMKRAGRLELEITDQLQELGGSRTFDYVALCRKVLMSGIMYGAGILKGPFVEEQPMRKWSQDATGRMVATTYTAFRPRFEWVPIWDYYPDMSAKTLAQMEGQFQRVVMSKHQVIMLKQREDFFAEQIDTFLMTCPNGNYVRRAYETEIRADGVQVNVNQSFRNKYEAYVWEGYCSGRELAECGLQVDPTQLDADLRAEVWVMGNYVVKAQLDPWAKLDTDGDMKQFHHFIFEDDETFLLGNALPNIVRDSQMGLAAATRMALDNGGIQRVFELNTSLLTANQDLTAITPDKIFYRDDESSATVQWPAVRPIELPMNLKEYQGLVSMFQEFADQETFVNAATGGDMQKGPSEPFRTATGASMLRGDAALPFKDVVRSFDSFTESVIGALINFNRNFNPKPEIKGDFKPVARGATSLIAKEVLGLQLDNLAATLTDGEKPYIKMRNLIRERVRIRDLTVEDIVMDDAECDAVDEQMQQQQSQMQDIQVRTMESAIRETLARALKEISQAGKNQAAAEAETANVILDALEKGINPLDISKGIPNGAQSNAGSQGQGISPGGAGAGEQAGGGAASAPTPTGTPTGPAGPSPAAMPTQ